MPLHSGAVDALRRLRAQPIVSPRVFPVKGSRCPSTFVSRRFAQLCMKPELTIQIEKDGQQITKNRWSLHDLRRKANTDLRNVGASAKERSVLLGHKTTSINEVHYEALLPSRERMLIDSLDRRIGSVLVHDRNCVVLVHQGRCHCTQCVAVDVHDRNPATHRRVTLTAAIFHEGS